MSAHAFGGLTEELGDGIICCILYKYTIIHMYIYIHICIYLKPDRKSSHLQMIFALKHVLKPSHKWNIPYKVRQLKIDINTEKNTPMLVKH